ncbi:MAG TPA: 1-deoxy-D-xylulose-5-phosphate synthase N-terminal domain-containing protein [Herpetosiphonaceae bacterium]
MASPTPSPSAIRWQDTALHVARAIRRRVLEHVIINNGGYLSQACSAAEILATLYTRIMRLGPSQAPLIPKPFPGVPGASNPQAFTGADYHGPKGAAFDRFIVSPAHYALPLYAALIEVDRLAAEALEQFNKDGSTVEMIGAEHSPGMEVTSGSLGQALSQAAGIALARKLRGETGRVWVLMSDGEFQSGQTWEALQVLAFHRLDNVGIYVDVNRQQCDGSMSDVLDIEPLDERIRAFGATVFAVDGHDVEALAAPAALPPAHKPLVVLAQTNPWQGIDLLRARAPKLHYVRFSSAEERQRFADLLATMP